MRVVPFLLAAACALLCACNPGHVECSAPKDSCGTTDTCFNLDSDPNHCGACGKACGSGQICKGGVCGCEAGVLCGSVCVSVESDASNCGACGKACKAGQACVAGTCGCAPDLTACGETCANVKADPKNCGSCGNACAANLFCQAGKCVADCSGDPKLADQCGASCVNLKTDALNCGTCAKACPATYECANGACACPAGTTECSGKCVDLQSDAANCSACGKACGQGQSCDKGTCRSTVFAACFNSGELVAMSDNGTPAAASVVVGAGPQALARDPSGAILVGTGIDNVLYSVDVSGTAPAKLAGGDDLGSVFNHLLVVGNSAYAVNSGDNNVQVLDLSKMRPDPKSAARTVDQIATKIAGGNETNTSPSFTTELNGKIYVTLVGTCFPDPTVGDAAGNRLLELDVSATPGKVNRELKFNAANFDKDTGQPANSPRPGQVVAAGGKLYVAIANQTPNCFGPAGPSYVAVVDPASMMMTGKIKMPDACRNAAFMTAAGTRVYLSCTGEYGYGAMPDEALVVIDTTTNTVLRTQTFARCGANDPSTCRTVVPGRLSTRGKRLYMADNNAGRVFVLDLDGKPVTGLESGVNICPLKCDSTGMKCFQSAADVLALP